MPFPFQAHLFALPAKTRQACVDGLLHRNTHLSPKNFEAWCLQSFGKGIYETFLRPYNTKLWGCPPKQLTCEWCNSYVPTPSVREIRQSAIKKPGKKFGYNAYFYYPQTGGCNALVTALANHVTQLKTRCAVTQIDLVNKTVRAGGKTISFDTLVNTLPLPVFLKLLKNNPTLNALAKKLSCQSVTVYQLALKGKPTPFSWLYCPDPRDPFYRVGMQSSFSHSLAPQGCYSLYVELPGLATPGKALARKIENALLQKGIISAKDKKLFGFFTKIPYAYVRYDKNRTTLVKRVTEKLARHRCFCAGRYGRWEYSFMEKSLLQGKEIAQKLV